ncbi:hypothetical protein Tco_0579341 [Tanacetum coccineum]
MKISFLLGLLKMRRLIKRMNEKGIDSSKNEVSRRRIKKKKVLRKESEIMEKKSVIARLNKVSSPDGDYLVIYRANGNFRAFNYLMEGDLKIMMESSTEGNKQSDFWSGQQDWKIITWRRYPLSKDLLQRMLDLGLEVERESYVALDLIRFIKHQIDEE